MQMANSNRQGIRNIRRFGDLGKIQQPFDHVLDLLLLCASVTNDSTFDGKRRIFRDFQTGRRGRKHSYTTHLAKFQSGLDIKRVEDIFDGNFIRLARNYGCIKAVKDPCQTFWDGFFR